SPHQVHANKSKAPVLLISLIAALVILALVWFLFFQDNGLQIPGFNMLTGGSEPSQNSSMVIDHPEPAPGPQILLEQEAEKNDSSPGTVLNATRESPQQDIQENTSH
ncbi:MAG: hypothetical protein DSZ23_00935, partial [Thermodesulfatator sp.]